MHFRSALRYFYGRIMIMLKSSDSLKLPLYKLQGWQFLLTLCFFVLEGKGYFQFLLFLGINIDLLTFRGETFLGYQC